MKMYAYVPGGHGQLSFFVCAETKSKAIAAIVRHAHEQKLVGTYATRGIGTDYYTLTEFEPEKVAENYND